MSTSINPAMQSMAPIQMGRQNQDQAAGNITNTAAISDDSVEMTAPATQVNLNSSVAAAPVDYLSLEPSQQVNEPVNIENPVNEQNTMTSGLTYASALQAESNFFSMQTGAADLTTATTNENNAS